MILALLLSLSSISWAQTNSTSTYVYQSSLPEVQNAVLIDPKDRKLRGIELRLKTLESGKSTISANVTNLSTHTWGNHITTITANGFFQPKKMTIAQIRAYTPLISEQDAIVRCSDCATEAVCITTGPTKQGFCGGSGKSNECK